MEEMYFIQPLENTNILRIITHRKFLRIKAEPYQITCLLNFLLKNVNISGLTIFVNVGFWILCEYLFSCCKIITIFGSMHSKKKLYWYLCKVIDVNTRSSFFSILTLKYFTRLSSNIYCLIFANVIKTFFSQITYSMTSPQKENLVGINFHKVYQSLLNCKPSQQKRSGFLLLTLNIILCNFESFSSVSIAEFEQVNFSWVTKQRWEISAG